MLSVMMVVVAGSTLLQGLHYHHQQQLQIEQHYTRAYTQQVALNSRDLFAIEDLLSLNVIAHQSSVSALVKGVRFEDAEGQLLASSGSTKPCPTVVISSPIQIVAGKTSGHVIICFDPPAQERPLTGWLIWFALVCACCALLYSLFRTDSPTVSQHNENNEVNAVTVHDGNPAEEDRIATHEPLSAYQSWQLKAQATNLDLLEQRLAPALLEKLQRHYLNLWQQHCLKDKPDCNATQQQDFKSNYNSADHHGFHQALASAERFILAVDEFNRKQRQQQLPILKMQVHIALETINFSAQDSLTVPIVVCTEGLPLATQATLVAREGAATLGNYASSPIVGLTLNKANSLLS